MEASSRFIGITSACGGVGTSSLAVTLGRILSRLNEKNVLYISFDCLPSKCEVKSGMSRRDIYDIYCKAGNGDFNACISTEEKIISDFIVKDDYGLNYLKVEAKINPFHKGIPDNDGFLLQCNLNYEFVILDVPSGSFAGVSVFNLCEDLIVNEGIAKPYQKKYCDDCYELLKILAPASRLHRFAAGIDAASFENGNVDIHGEYGSEVRKLVTQLGI